MLDINDFEYKYMKIIYMNLKTKERFFVRSSHVRFSYIYSYLFIISWIYLGGGRGKGGMEEGRGREGGREGGGKLLEAVRSCCSQPCVRLITLTCNTYGPSAASSTCFDM